MHWIADCSVRKIRLPVAVSAPSLCQRSATELSSAAYLADWLTPTTHCLGCETLTGAKRHVQPRAWIAYPTKLPTKTPNLTYCWQFSAYWSSSAAGCPFRKTAFGRRARTGHPRDCSYSSQYATRWLKCLARGPHRPPLGMARFTLREKKFY